LHTYGTKVPGTAVYTWYHLQIYILFTKNCAANFLFADFVFSSPDSFFNTTTTYSNQQLPFSLLQFMTTPAVPVYSSSPHPTITMLNRGVNNNNDFGVEGTPRGNDHRRQADDNSSVFWESPNAPIFYEERYDNRAMDDAPRSSSSHSSEAAAPTATATTPGGGDNQKDERKQRRQQVGGAAVVGGLAGLVLGGPVVALVAAGGAAALATRPGRPGEVARAAGDVSAQAGKRLQKINQKHKVAERTSEGVVKGCNWVSKKIAPKK